MDAKRIVSEYAELIEKSKEIAQRLSTKMSMLLQKEEYKETVSSPTLRRFINTHELHSYLNKVGEASPRKVEILKKHVPYYNNPFDEETVSINDADYEQNLNFIVQEEGIVVRGTTPSNEFVDSTDVSLLIPYAVYDLEGIELDTWVRDVTSNALYEAEKVLEGYIDLAYTKKAEKEKAEMEEFAKQQIKSAAQLLLAGKEDVPPEVQAFLEKQLAK